MDPRTSAQDVMRCDLCDTAVVQMHCDTCLVNLCKACVGEHMISDESKKHEIVRFQLRKSTLIYPLCKFHKNERCEMYCNQCDIPICSACIASGNHSGHNILQIIKVYNARKEEIEREMKEIEQNIYPTYQNIASDVQNRISQLEKEYGDLSTAITKHGEDWHREIDKLVKNLKAEVEKMKAKHHDALKAHKDEINQLITDIYNEIQASSKLLELNDISLFLKFNTNIQEFRKLPSKVNVTLPHFTPTQYQPEQLIKLFGNLSSLSLTSEEHGYKMKTTKKSPEAGSSPPVRQLLDEPETITSTNTGYDRLYNVVCLSDEEIWTRGNDNTMKLYSINQGSLLKSIRTKSGNQPYDIAVTKSGDLVYTDYWDRTVNIVKNEKIEELIRLQNWIPYRVCSTSSGDLLVIMYSDDYKQIKVVCYSGSTGKQTIQFDDKGQPLYSSGGYITENRNLDICVSDLGAKAVVVVNQAGKLRFRYTGHTPAPKNKSFNPRGITTDSQSHILTADSYNNCVHIIDQDGQFLRYIDCGLSEPWGLCIDTNDNLFVAHTKNKTEVIIKIKYMYIK
ncbi:E3 ubiquitin-protein ligase TRIM71-like isoform X2 [Saccostrea echinata]|uniref:E3 ubiquitin-protein ligase TRIM71-like isoform X2 n=1 Tax=Saccostrea echinata TaxID=191078 RepID=UPI002A8204CA|nr:E3 ubiquitin-protein ligase TRIM71-like isoform X2 [Saccostrea echinata]